MYRIILDALIGIAKENRGEIYFSYHDKDEKYIKISDSFADFIEQCKSEKVEVSTDIKTVEERKQMLIDEGRENLITP